MLNPGSVAHKTRNWRQPTYTPSACISALQRRRFLGSRLRAPD